MEIYGGVGIPTNGLFFLMDSLNTKSYNYSNSPSYAANLMSGVTYSLLNGTSFNNRDFVFDGIDDYINIGNLTASGNVPQYTCNVWFNSSAVVNYKNVIDFNGGNILPRLEQYSPGGYPLPSAANSSDAVGSKTARFAVSITQGGDYYGFFNDFPPYVQMVENYWYNVIFSWDNINKKTKIFINGIKYVDIAGLSNWNDGITAFKIGIGYDSSRYFQGKIPYVSIYNRILTDSEVYESYNTLKHRFPN